MKMGRYWGWWPLDRTPRSWQGFPTETRKDLIPSGHPGFSEDSHETYWLQPPGVLEQLYCLSDLFPEDRHCNFITSQLTVISVPWGTSLPMVLFLFGSILNTHTRITLQNQHICPNSLPGYLEPSTFFVILVFSLPTSMLLRVRILPYSSFYSQYLE